MPLKNYLDKHAMALTSVVVRRIAADSVESESAEGTCHTFKRTRDDVHA